MRRRSPAWIAPLAVAGGCFPEVDALERVRPSGAELVVAELVPAPPASDLRYGSAVPTASRADEERGGAWRLAVESEPDGRRARLVAYAARGAADGGRRVLDPFACPGCPASAVSAPDGNGWLVAWRDREGDARVPVVAVFDPRRAEPLRPVRVAPGAAACPRSAPAIAASGERVAVAWIDADARVGAPRRLWIAQSRDAGRSFGPPVELAAGAPEASPAVALFDDGSALAAWLESGRASAEWRVRRVTATGLPGDALTVLPCDDPASVARPRLDLSGGEVRLIVDDPGRGTRRWFRVHALPGGSP